MAIFLILTLVNIILSAYFKMAQISSANIKLILLQLLSLILNILWVSKFIHYFIQPLPFFFNSSSAIPLSEHQTQGSIDRIDLIKTFFNILMFGVFFLQHFVMAGLKWKISSAKLWPMYPVYERLFYNIISSSLLITVLEHQQPNTQILFTLPKWFCLPLALIGSGVIIHSDMQMDKSILLPYSWSELFSREKINVNPDVYKRKQQKGISMKGAYALIRHPMQGGTLLAITFGSHIFTFQKVVLVSTMAIFIFIGVKLEESRLLRKFQQYESYMKKVQYRFFPYLI